MPQERKKKQFSVRVYDQKHLRNLSKRLRKVQALIDEAARKGAAIGARTGYKDIEKDFRFDDFPQARREIDALLRELSTALTMNVEEANTEAWGMANAKNDAMVDSMLASTGVDMAKKTTQPWYNKNARALGAFQKRVKDGMGLSTDVWNLGQFKGELELALEMGLGRGKSAAELSRDVRSFLKYPDKLFRRVRDEKGVLRLSKAAKEFHPGRGVYRSSYKNALRLTATETNMAYRTADSKRWQQIPFVLGIKIQVSKTNHPVTDICDELAGDYPKDFVFTGWHPFCKCFATSILPTPEKFLEYQRAILDGKDVSGWQWEGEVKDVPGEFNTWIDNNRERAKGWSNMPYFVRDNPQYVNGFEVNTYSEAERKFTRARRTNEAMKESLDKYLQKLYPEMPNTEKAAIYHYTQGNTSAYRQLNKQLRDGKLSEFNEAFSELLSNALQKLPPMEATVYRTIRLNKTRLRAFTEMATNGAEATFEGFTSTTLDRSIAELFAANHEGIKKNETDVLLVIGGKSGRSVEDFSQFGVRYNKPNQREVLFDKGMKVRFDRVVQEDGAFVFYITEL